MKWSNGRHPYYGKANGRAQRQRSKIVKGLKINKKKLLRAFRLIERESKSMNEAQEFYKQRHGRYFTPPKNAVWGFQEHKPRSTTYISTEKTTQKAILSLLAAKGIFHYRQNSGVDRSQGRFVRYGTPGAPDIIAVHNGKYIGIEVKDIKGKLSENQVKFKEKLEAAGGVYITARSVNDVNAVLFVN